LEQVFGNFKETFWRSLLIKSLILAISLITLKLVISLVLILVKTWAWLIDFYHYLLNLTMASAAKQALPIKGKLLITGLNQLHSVILLPNHQSARQAIEITINQCLFSHFQLHSLKALV